MGLKRVNVERDSDLIRAIREISYPEKVRFDYIKGLNEIKTRTYVLPVESHDGVPFGIFRNGSQVEAFPLGFMHRKGLVDKTFYHLTIGCSVEEVEPNQDFLYLPLRITGHLENIGECVKNEFFPKEDSPFFVFGLNGTRYKYPLLLAFETDEGNKLRGLYKESNGGLDVYDCRKTPKPNEVKKFLRKFFPVKIKHELEIRVQSEKLEDKKEEEIQLDKFKVNWQDPKSIYDYLNRFVISQEDAKRRVAVGFSNYMVKVKSNDPDLPQDHMLIVGPTGSGKSLMIRLLARKANLSVASKATGKSSEGYKGENLSTVFDDIRKTTEGYSPYGIIVIDEVDKLALGHSFADGYHTFGNDLQNELIGWMDDDVIRLGREKGETESMSTKNLWFVCTGAFSGIERIISSRLGIRNMIGFGNNNGINRNDVINKLSPEDLIKYGFKPELIGRFTSIGITNRLSDKDKVRILRESKASPIKRYRALIKQRGFDLRVDGDALEVIAQRCPKETGARALSSICGELFNEIIFNISDYESNGMIVLNKNRVLSILEP